MKKSCKGQRLWRS